MAPVTRKQAPAAAAVAGVNFGDEAFYSGGFGLPEGDYALFFDVRIHAFTKASGQRGTERLGVMLTAYPLAGGEPQEAFLSMGSKAHLSFAPDPDTGKQLLPIPGAEAGSMAGSTNWNLFRKSMVDCDPAIKEIFTNDISVLDGVWVHIQNVPEPEERKGFGSQTGEVAQQRQGPQLIPVVTEIKEDGKPWENGGGMPEGAAVEAPPAAKPAAAKPGAKVAAKPTPAAAANKPKAAAKVAAPVVEEESGDEAAMEAASAAIASVLEKSPNGLLRLQLRIQTFNAAKSLAGEEMAQTVIDTFFADDASLNSVLGGLGYAVQGSKIAPAA